MIAVLGSINMDLTAFVPRLPQPGETLFGRSFLMVPGGKGANQAVAAARLGARVRFFGRVGQDSFGEQHVAAMEHEGVNITGIYRDDRHATGLAVISVDDAGENTIIVISGANMAVDVEDVARLRPSLDGTKVLLLQQEIPSEANLAAAATARRHGVTVILDPAPARELPRTLLPLIDVITPNEGEAETLLGRRVSSVDEAKEAAAEFRRMGIACAVIKLGARGAVYENETGAGHIAPFPVRAVDTVAAGDAFNAGLAVALAEGRPLPAAMRWASAAGALAVTKAGAMPSLPMRSELLQLLGEEA